ncbi:MAG: 5'/3'-nucleotidase SurE [Deltaproteobacteria bacterium]|nr:MAG: 5'/3'-nucleotidase SurE [Deltaproteobacteria bacterium]
MPPLLLLSNDDGIDAPGLAALADALAPLAELVVVAPERERSAVSHAITLHKPLRPTRVRDGWFALSGTPADCVYAGVLRIAPERPALVVSGINDGNNLGSDVFYSGTVAAAAEAALRDVPAIALSQAPGANFAHSAQFAAALVRAALAHPLPPKCLLNVNFPRDFDRAYRWTKLGARVYRDQVEEREDLRGRTYYWIGGPSVDVADEPNTDGATVREGLVSITPLRLDLTAHDLLDPPPAWPIDGYSARP